MRVLLAWELGGHLGHLGQLLPVARELRARGHEPVFAVRDVQAFGRLAAGEFECFALPRPDPVGRDGSISGYADILWHAGLRDAEELSALLAAWGAVIRAVKPDRLLLEYAPIGVVAAHCFGVPAVELGTGFTLPPAQAGRPELPVWRGAAGSDPAGRERLLLAAIGEAATRMGGNAPASFSALHGTSRRVFATFAELDPFERASSPSYCGPIQLGRGREPLQFGNSPRRALAYLRWREARSRAVLLALDRSMDETVAVSLDAPPEAESVLGLERTRIVREPLDLRRGLGGCDLVASHGGHGIASLAFAAGVPQLLAPVTVEEALTSQALARHRAAHVAPPGTADSEAGRIVDTALQLPRGTIRNHDTAHAVGAVIEALEA